MVTAIIKKNCFRFDQLSRRIQERVYHEVSTSENEYHCECVNNVFTELIQSLGLADVISARWSLSYSQGDGVSFDQDKGEYFTRDHIERYANIFHMKDPRKASLIPWLFESGYFRMNIVRNNHRYFYENAFHVEYEIFLGYKERPKIERIIKEFCETFECFLREQCRSFEKQGYAILEHFNEKYYEEEFNEQQMLFTENGEVIDPEDVENLSEVREQLYKEFKP